MRLFVLYHCPIDTHPLMILIGTHPLVLMEYADEWVRKNLPSEYELKTHFTDSSWQWSGDWTKPMPDSNSAYRAWRADIYIESVECF